MPKGSSPLTAAEVDLIRQWIIAVAREWPPDFRLKEPTVENFDWWSLRPLETHAPPTFEDSTARSWLKTPMDAFVLQTLQDHSLTPSPERDPRTLIRRVTFDLTGLPPTPEEIKAYMDDTASDAYERVVDRLLDSPHYGERWAGHWLDVVRYADTCGDHASQTERLAVPRLRHSGV